MIIERMCENAKNVWLEKMKWTKRFKILEDVKKNQLLYDFPPYKFEIQFWFFHHFLFEVTFT